MSNENAGRTPRTAGGNAPMGSTVAIVVTAAAVILGFLILKKINDGDGGTTKPAGTTTSSSLVDTSTTLDFTSTTSEPPLVTKGTKVQVANASNASGVAKQMTTALSGVGFDTADATNATVDPKLDVSKVIYDSADPNALLVAQSVAKVLGGIAVEIAPSPPPVEAGAFASGSAVIVLLGNDLAGKTLDEIAGQPTSGTTVPTTAAPVTAVPTTTG